jgi:choline dehydrogenase-like flavoprotein
VVEKTVDALIVGSGAGGGVVARELAPLARAGARIAVLEAGPRLRPEEFTGRELEMVGRLYYDGGGILTKDGAITIAMGRAYGGSTVVYTGTSLSIPAEVLGRWAVPGLEFDDVARRTRKYAGDNDVHLQDETRINDNNRLFRLGCERLGWRVSQFPINVRGCKGAGLCNLGCPHGAKRGTHVVQLPEAEAAGVEVVTNCRVTRLGEREVTAVVANAAIGAPSAWAPGEYRVRARRVVLAAGALRSPALLAASGLARHLPAVGRWLTLHPALVLVGKHDRPLTNYVGHPKSYYCNEFAASHGFLLETCMYFPFMTAKSLAGFGAQHSAMMRGMDRQQQVLVLALDDARPENRVTVDGRGEPVVRYRLTPKVLDSLFASIGATARLLFAAGATSVHAPTATKFAIDAGERDRLDALLDRRRLRPGSVSIASAHVMGGCRMGADPETSVTDAWGSVHGVPWLSVADASLFPRCSEINPYLTIMALADRVAQTVRASL